MMRYKLITTLFALLVLIALGLISISKVATAQVMGEGETILFNDNFDRPDDGAVGNGWSEIEAGGAAVTIFNGKLYFSDSSDRFNRPVVAHLFAKAKSGKLVWEFDFDWTRTGSEGTYRLFMQLGEGSLLTDVDQDAGVGVNLIWTKIDGVHETLGYRQGGAVTALTGLSGLHHVTVEIDLDNRTYEVAIDGSVVQSQIQFDNLVEVDTVRFFADAVNEVNFSGRSFDEVEIRSLTDWANQAPQINTTPPATATEGVLYTYAAAASDPDAGDLLTFSLDDAPFGLSVDATTGLIQWTPASDQLGDYAVVLRVTDRGGLFDTQSFIITVGEEIILFSDSFDRPDHGAVGNGWSEIETSGSAAVGILNGTLHFSDASDRLNRPMVTHQFTEASSGKLVWEFDFDWTRTGPEGNYRLFMQLGEGSLMTDVDQDAGVGVNLVWTRIDGVHQNLGYRQGGAVTRLTDLSGSHHVTVEVDLDSTTYEVAIDGSVVLSDIAFDNAVALDTVRFFTDALNEQNFSGRSLDEVKIRKLSSELPDNQPPLAVDQGVVTTEGAPMDITLSSTDPDGPGPYAFTIASVPLHGVLSGDDGDEFVLYTPEIGYDGQDSFTFKVNDGVSDSNIGTVTITVNGMNTTPVAEEQSVTTDEDTARPITLRAFDADGDALIYSTVTSPTNGTLSGAAPNLTYAPNGDYDGWDSFTFQANDGTDYSNVATVTIMVNPVNDPPVFTIDPIDKPNATAGEVYADTIAGTAVDIENDPLTFTKVSGPSWLQISAHGSLSGTPGTGDVGPNAWNLGVSDGNGGSHQTTLNIMVGEIVSQGDVPIVVPITGFSETVDGVSLFWEKAYYQDLDITGAAIMEIPFGLTRPKDYVAGNSTKYPLVLYLHGAGARRDWTNSNVNPDNRDHTLVDAVLTRATPRFFAKSVQTDPLLYNAFVLAPQVSSKSHRWVETSWSDGPYTQTSNPGDTYSEYMHLVENLLEYMTDSGNNGNLSTALGINASDIDLDRIYVVGDSMGAYGTWDILARHPNLFAGAIASGGSGPENKLAELSQTPLWTIHGANDSTVPNELPSGPGDLGRGTLGMLGLMDPSFDNSASTSLIYLDQPDLIGDDPVATESLIYTEFSSDFNHSEVTNNWTAMTSGVRPWLFAQSMGYGVNQAPFAEDQSVTTTEGTLIDITLRYSDPDGPGPYTFTVIEPPSHGVLTDENGDELVVYTPDAGHIGPDSFTWKVNDGLADSDEATVTINTGGVNHFPGATWEFKAPAEVGLNGAKLDQFATNVGGVGCIVKDGYMVKTWGDQGLKADWASSRKPVTSTLLFFAVQEGLVDSVDELVKDWGWALNDKDQTITFRHLANMVSGYARAEVPGAAWAYNSYAVKLYSLTLEEVFQQSLDDAALQRLAPLQFQDGSLFTSREGHGIFTTPRDFARIGWFWLNKGNWNGTQLLSRSYFDNYMRPGVPGDLPRTTAAASDYLGIGSDGGGSDQTVYGPGIYGFNWWFNAKVGTSNVLTWPDAPLDTFQANGHWGREVITVIPSLNMVVAARGNWGSFAPGDPDSGMNLNLKLLVEAVGGNAAPTAEAQSLTTTEDTPLDITLSHSDPDGPGPYTFTVIEPPSHGVLTDENGDELVVYTPDAGHIGPDSFTWKVNDGQADSNIATVTITVNGTQNQLPVASFKPDPTSGEPPLLVDLDATWSDDPDGAIQSYEWDFGDGNTASGIIVSHTYAKGGTYTVTLTVTDNQGGAGTAAETVTVGEAPESGRITQDLVVYYPFIEGSGAVVQDQSAYGTPMDLTITGSVDWNAGENGVVMSGGRIGTVGQATKVIDALQATNQSTFEIWISADNLSQSGPARMISVGGDASRQNFVLGQTGDDVQVRLLHTAKDYKAKPRLTTTDNFLSTNLTHIVHTYDGATERLYVNGVEHPTTVVLSGNFSNWDANDQFNIGNEASSDRPWYGIIRLVAVYNRALTVTEIQQNFAAGANVSPY